MSNEMILDWLMARMRSIDVTPIQTLTAFKRLIDREAGQFIHTVDRAVGGGFLADRVAYAFAAGYEAALKRLVPGLPEGPIVSLCVSEEGGAHPRSIETQLVADRADGFRLTGKKSFITAATDAEIMLVAASRGKGDDGRNRISMAIVERARPGVTITPMQDLPFVPEIGHGVVVFDDVPVDPADILPGDGYADYIKPFRTIEDIHVIAAVMGYLLRVAFLSSWPYEVSEELLLLIAAARTIAAEDPLSPAVHVTLGGLMAVFGRFVRDIDPLWDRATIEARSGWMRDRALLGVAGKARAARLAAAWERYNR